MAGIHLNDEKFGMRYGNHIRRLVRKRIGVSFFYERCLDVEETRVLCGQLNGYGFLYGNHIISS